MRTSRCASIGIVTELVNMESSLSVGIVTTKVPCDGRWGRLGFLLEGDGPGDLGVSSYGCDCREGVSEKGCIPRGIELVSGWDMSNGKKA